MSAFRFVYEGLGSYRVTRERKTIGWVNTLGDREWWPYFDENGFDGLPPERTRVAAAESLWSFDESREATR